VVLSESSPHMGSDGHGGRCERHPHAPVTGSEKAIAPRRAAPPAGADMILSDVRRLRVAEIGGAASLVQDTLNRASATDDRHDRPR
jgi:hypothetical protein